MLELHEVEVCVCVSAWMCEMLTWTSQVVLLAFVVSFRLYSISTFFFEIALMFIFTLNK